MTSSGKATPLGVTVCQPTLPRLEIRKATKHLGSKGMGRRRKRLVFEQQVKLMFCVTVSQHAVQEGTREGIQVHLYELSNRASPRMAREKEMFA